MVRIGIVGLGFMGMIHYLAAGRSGSGRVYAICTRDKAKLTGDWRSIRGNFGPPGEQVDLSNIRRYQSVKEIFADPEIDLIDICTPTHLHSETAIAALRAGKHVLVEKAIALTQDEADAMLGAASEANRFLMVAHVLPFFPEFAYAAEAVRSGRFGTLRAAQFTRVIAKPDWSADIGDAEKTGGPAVDLHIHDTHFIGLVCGVPKAVFSTGVIEGGTVAHLTTQYLYGDGGPSVTCTSGALIMPSRPFVHGFEIQLDRATLTYSSSGVPLTVHHADGSTELPQLPGGGDPITAFADEIATACEAVRTGKMPDLLDGRLARNALMLCCKEIESVRTGAIVTVGE